VHFLDNPPGVNFIAERFRGSDTTCSRHREDD
jgi:hypothetical protein